MIGSIKKIILVSLGILASVFAGIALVQAATGGAAYRPVPLPDPFTYYPGLSGYVLTQTTTTIVYIPKTRIIEYRYSKADAIYQYPGINSMIGNGNGLNEGNGLYGYNGGNGNGTNTINVPESTLPAVGADTTRRLSVPKN